MQNIHRTGDRLSTRDFDQLAVRPPLLSNETESDFVSSSKLAFQMWSQRLLHLWILSSYDWGSVPHIFPLCDLGTLWPPIIAVTNSSFSQRDSPSPDRGGNKEAVVQALRKYVTLLYGYGSIPMNTIFRGMNIHKSQLFWCELQGYYWFWHTIIYLGGHHPAG